jgi:hypothetical protein
MHLVK